MKKYLLFIIGCLCASIDALAYDYNVPGTINFRDDGEFQYVELETPGALSAFILGTTSAGSGTSDNFNQYFQTSTSRPYVIFSGPMNDDDINIITNNLSSTAWNQRNVLDFTEVTTDVTPKIEYGDWNRVQLIIWPACHEPSIEEQSWMSSQLWQGQTGWAYYKNNDKNTLCMMAANMSAARGTAFINDLATLMANDVLSFNSLCIDYSENAQGTGWDYYNAYSNFVSDLSNLPVENLDLHGLNISSLGKDFSGLNPATHYLVLPLSGDQYKAENDIVSSNFKYSNELCVVSAYLSTTAPYGTSGSFNGRLEMVGGEFPSTLSLTKVLKPGTLSGAEEYLSDEQKMAESLMMIGTINNEDLVAMSAVRSSYVNLRSAIIDEGSSITSYENDYVKYLALPYDASVEDFVPATFKAKCPSLLGLGLYKEVTNVVPTEENPVPEEKDNKLYYASWQVGGVRTIMNMLPEAQTDGSSVNGVHSYKMWGPLNHADIANTDATNVGNDGNYSSTANEYSKNIAGLLGKSTKIYDADLSMAWFPNQDDMNFNIAAAYGANTFAACELPRTHMTTIPANAFNNMQALHYIGLPNIYTTIKENAFYEVGILPVGDGSLVGPLQIDTYEVEKVTDTYSYTADDALIKEVVTNGPLTVTLPESLGHSEGEGLYTGSMQFTPRVKDVYVMADPAPYCQIDAFGSVAYVGNNTYGGVTSHPFARDKYRMGVGTYTEETENQWICVLHFPASTVKNGQNKNYTDPTREYCLYDETGEVDGNGMPVVWPNQSEMLRSYNQAVTGVTWNAWDRTRVENEQFGNYNEFVGAEGYGVYNTPTPEYNIDATLTYDKEHYCGWHQFILANTWLPIPDIDEHKEVNYVKLDWFTFCIPYNMTKKQVIELLGVPASDGNVTRKLNGEVVTADKLPDVRTLVAVTRYPFKDQREIKLHLSKNIVEQPNDLYVDLRYDNTNYELPRVQANSDVLSDGNWVPLTGDENQVYVKGGYPYLIRAYVPEEMKDMVTNLGGFTLMRGTFGSENAGYKHTCTDGYASVAPYEQKVQAYINEEGKGGVENPAVYPALFDDTEDETETTSQAVPEGKERYIYTFVGQYWPQYLPLYSYYLGTNSKAAETADTKRKFYRATAKLDGTSETFSKWAWNPYVAIITANADPKDVHEPHVNSSTGAYTSSLTMDFNGYDDTFGKGKAYNGTGDENGAKYVFVFDDGIEEDLSGDATGETTSIGYFNGTPVLPANGKIYNVNGQMVGNSVSSLQKGLYIVNGKKFVIK